MSNSHTLVIFEGNINITRASHILKISNIITHTSGKVTIAISRITYEALLDLAKKQLPNTNIIILDSKEPVIAQYKYSLFSWLKEWILHLIQLLRLFISIRNNKPENTIVMGTINIPAILLARLFCKRMYIFAGGFTYMMSMGSRTLKLILSKVRTYLVELFAVLLAQYIIVESKSMRRYVPGIKMFKPLINSKIIDYGALYADPEFFKCPQLEERDEVIGYVGALEHRRASIELIEAFRIVARLNPRIRFLLIGSGVLEPKIREIVYGDHEFRGRITHIKHVSRKDLPRYLSKIRIFVFPSRADGLPNTILEALACGCIVLATPVGGMPDVIKDNVTGYNIHGSLEPINIANHIIQILNMPKDRLKEVSLNGKRFVEKYYGYTATLSRWKNIISSH